MNFLMHKPTIEGMPAASPSAYQARRAPAFRPDVSRSVRMHPTVVAVVSSLVLAAILAYAFRQKPMFYTESLIKVEPAFAKVLSDGSAGMFDANKYDSYIQQQTQTAQRVDVVASALATLPRQTWQEFGPTLQSATAIVQNQLKIARVQTSYQMAIGLKGTNPVATAAVVNAVTQTYLQAARKDDMAQSEQRAQLLTDERQRIEDELTRARTEQASLGVSLGVANPTGEGSNAYDSQLSGMRAQLDAAREVHSIAAAQMASVATPDGRRAPGLTVAADEAIAGDPGLSSMKATISQRRANLVGQMAGLTQGNPIYQQDQQEIADLDRSLDVATAQAREKAARAVQSKFKVDLDRTGDIQARINAQLASQTATATHAGPKLQRAAELAGDMQRLIARYATVDDALRSLQLETSGPGMAHLLLPAAVPVTPEPNRRNLLLLLALPLALFCGGSAAVFQHKRDSHIYIARDIEGTLGFAPIAVLPAAAQVSDAAMDQYVLRLAAGIESAYRAREARTFVFTAVSPSTSVSALVEALKTKLRELELSVIVLSASQMLRRLPEDQTNSRGGTTEGIVTFNLERFKQANDVIFLDTPPLLTAAETEYVARCADATILVAECGVTTRAELFQAAALLQRLGVRGVGAVLDEMQLRFADGAFKKAVAAIDQREITAKVPLPSRAEATVSRTVPLKTMESSQASAVLAAQPLPAPPVATPQQPAAHHGSSEVPEDLQAAPPVQKFVVGDLLVEPAPALEVQDAEPVVRSEPQTNPMTTLIWKSSLAEGRSNPVQTSSYALEGAKMTPNDWFQRLLARDEEHAPSILPDFQNEDDADTQVDPIHAGEFPPSVPLHTGNREDLDLPLPMPAEVAPIVSQPLPLVEAGTKNESLPAPTLFVVNTANEEHVSAPRTHREFAPKAPGSEGEASTPVRPLSFFQLSQTTQFEHNPEALPAEPDHQQFHAATAPQAVEANDSLHDPTHEPVPAPHALHLVTTPESRVEPSVLLTQTESTAGPDATNTSEAIPVATSVEAVAAAVEPIAPTAEPVAPAAEPLAEPVEAVAASVEAVAASVEAVAASVEHVAASVEHVAAPVELVTSIASLEPEDSYFDETADDILPEPPSLGRWEPIPPLRSIDEPWRGDSGAQAARRWDTLIQQPAARSEANDQVLTRRWTLLSRFQQGEAFKAASISRARLAHTDAQRETVPPGGADGHGRG